MKRKIILILNYKGHFSSKWSASPYYSGMDILRLREEFEKKNIQIEYLHYPEVNLRDRNFKDEIILYTSSEDHNLLYKSYIEDIILALEIQGARLIPPFFLLKAHHNKVFMELLRDLSPMDHIKNIRSNNYGTLEDFENKFSELQYPKVFKGASGAVSSSVRLVKSKDEAIKTIKKLCRSRALYLEVWDFGRFIIHKGYKRDSKYRRKFILQNFILNMDGDWKIIVFGKKYYVLERKVRKNDFRASGSGLIEYNRNLPLGLLDYAKSIFDYFDIPFMAMDIGFDGCVFYLIEYQTLNFGTHTVDTAPFYFLNNGNKWEIIEEVSIVEREFAISVTAYLEGNG